MRKIKTVEHLSVLFIIVLVVLFSSPVKAEESRLTFSSDLSQPPDITLEFMMPLSFATDADYASSQGTYQSEIYGNYIYEENQSRTTEISGSSNENSGIISINQASGSMNNQENVRIVTLISEANSLSNMQMSKVARISSNETQTKGSNNRKNIIEDSFNDNTGIIGVNQSSGNYNIQSNNLLMAVGGLVTLDNIELEGVIFSDNVIDQDESGDRQNLVNNSFSNTSGIVQVTQASGDMSVLGNNLALSMREINLK